MLCCDLQLTCSCSVATARTGLLDLPAGSKDAQVFEQYAKQQAAAAAQGGGAPTSEFFSTRPSRYLFLPLARLICIA
jgi:hypothetical protein